MPISLRLVEQELTGKKETAADYKDVRIISEATPKVYSQGTIETLAAIDKIGHYALYLIIGDEQSASADDILKIRFYVGAVTEAMPFWRYVAKAAELFMTFAFPALILLLIMSPMLPKLRFAALSKMLPGMQDRKN